MTATEIAFAMFGKGAQRKILRIISPWASFTWDRIEDGWSYEIDGDKKTITIKPCL